MFSPSRSPRSARPVAASPRLRGSIKARPSLEALEAIMLLSGTPNDFTGSGQADYVVFDKSTATFEVTNPNSPGVVQKVQVGNPAHDLVPVPGNYSGQGHFDFAVYDKTVATYFVKFASNPNVLGESSQIGNPAHAASIIPTPGDFNGDGRLDFGIYDRTVATYFVKDSANPTGGLLASSQVGDPAHGSSIVPVPGIYQGTTKDDFAIYDKTVATFFVKYATNPNVLGASSQVGDPGHAASIVPVPADYNADGRFDFAIFDPTVSTYFVKYDNAPDTLGESSQIGDPSHASSIIPLPGDYDNDGKSDFGIFDKSLATFYVKYATNPHAALAVATPDGDPAHANFLVPITGDFNGDHKLDATVFDKGAGTFFSKFSTNPTATSVVAPVANTSHAIETVPEPA